jgi:hypothetical protein
MHINKVKTAIKVGEFVLYPEHPRNKIRTIFNTQIDQKILTNEAGRVYLFVIDGIIKKIGGSSGMGGIKSTLSFYTGSMTGSPGKPRFILHLLIRDELKKGRKVEIFMIMSNKAIAPVSGLFDSKEMEIASFKEMEDRCRKDYFLSEQSFPEWNFKENNKSYPDKYAMEQVRYHEHRLRGKVYIPK